ncbi:MAG: DUF167 domain-containing protein [Epsilonproteobacteria bacterium]|nr:DUF167 domain-containing protein [Campylobacterota bacterium]
MREDRFFHFKDKTLVLNVLGTPSAKVDKIGKVRGNQLKIAIKAAAENGKATEYMIKFLAKEFGVKKADISLTFGLTSVNKQFKIINPTKLPKVISEYIDKEDEL